MTRYYCPVSLKSVSLFRIYQGLHTSTHSRITCFISHDFLYVTQNTTLKWITLAVTKEMKFIVMLTVSEEARRLCITVSMVNQWKVPSELEGRHTLLQLGAYYLILACLLWILELLQTLESYLCSGKWDKAALWEWVVFLKFACLGAWAPRQLVRGNTTHAARKCRRLLRNNLLSNSVRICIRFPVNWTYTFSCPKNKISCLWNADRYSNMDINTDRLSEIICFVNSVENRF